MSKQPRNKRWGNLLSLIILLIPTTFAITITEINYNPVGADNNLEYLEVYASNLPSLSGFFLGDEESIDELTLLKYVDSSPFALIVEDGFDYQDLNCSIYSAGASIGNNLGNTKDNLILYSANMYELSNAFYDVNSPNKDGFVLEPLNETWILTNKSPCTKRTINKPNKFISNCYINITSETIFQDMPLKFKFSTDSDWINYTLKDIKNQTFVSSVGSTLTYRPKTNQSEKVYILTAQTTNCSKTKWVVYLNSKVNNTILKEVKVASIPEPKLKRINSTNLYESKNVFLRKNLKYFIMGVLALLIILLIIKNPFNKAKPLKTNPK
jgi:hypothetical protein